MAEKRLKIEMGIDRSFEVDSTANVQIAGDFVDWDMERRIRLHLYLYLLETTMKTFRREKSYD